MYNMQRFVVLVFRNEDDIANRFYADRRDVAISRAKFAMRKIASIRKVIIKDNDGEDNDVIIRK